MGTPLLQHQHLKLTPSIDELNQSDVLNPEVSVLSLGNPHAVLRVKSLSHFPVNQIGQQIGNHSFFPKGVNVGFMEIIDRNSIRLRTYERGVGETLSCGSNACAAVVACIWNNLLDKKVIVELELGNLQVEWAGNKEPVLLTGSANRVFDGNLVIK